VQGSDVRHNAAHPEAPAVGEASRPTRA
jgi:hypothetical protein